MIVGMLWADLGYCATLVHYRFEEGIESTSPQVLRDSGPFGLDGAIEGASIAHAIEAPPFIEAGERACYLRRGGTVGVVPYDPVLAMSGSFTVEFFFNRQFSSSVEDHAIYPILSQSLQESNYEDKAWWFEYRPCNQELRVTLRFTDETTFTMPIHFREDPLERWHHVALVHRREPEQGSTAFYVDGGLVAYGSLRGQPPPASGGGPLLIGGDRSSPINVPPANLGGVYDEIRISDTALEPSQFVVDLSPKPLEATITPMVEVAWPSRSDTLYQVQWCSVLDSNAWFDLENGLLYGDGFTNTVCDPLAQPGQRYYRVIAVE